MVVDGLVCEATQFCSIPAVRSAVCEVPASAVMGGVVKFTVPLLVPQVTRYLLDNGGLYREYHSKQFASAEAG
ncbi:MAG TPA: hypothetical protein PKH24_04940 [Sedimentisphaerales bacterium]|jgi:hypothetical protein|nr:hypothetical protein [Sedimentisphaerales bacterium]HNU29343.1 hypothetical protein [Sedimentisphaerales bacterium]